jgi:hypothetical protein
VQKLTLYLGNPSAALAVVLFAMLVFSGFGSLLSAALPGRADRRLGIACVIVAGLLLVYRVALDSILHGTLGLSLPWRITLVLLVVAPPAIVMGIPFPTAVRALGRDHRSLVAGGWVVNGYFSVLASCLAIVLSISLGFGAVLLVGAATYSLAAFTSLWAGRLSAPTAAVAPLTD